MKQKREYVCQHDKLEEVKTGGGDTIAMQCSCCLKFWPWELCANCQRTARITEVCGHGRYCSKRCREDSAAKRAKFKSRPDGTKSSTP